MATVYEIIQGLSQAAANAYDGATDDKGEPLKAGLQREEGDPLVDKRVMDGFNVKFYGNLMCLSYMSEVHLREVHAKGFESDVEARLAEIVSFLKKEYRKIQGESVKLTKEGEIDVRVENSSRVRSWVVAKMHYKVDGLDKAMNNDNSGNPAPAEASWKKFLEQGGWNGEGGKRPDNDSRPKSSDD